MLQEIEALGVEVFGEAWPMARACYCELHGAFETMSAENLQIARDGLLEIRDMNPLYFAGDVIVVFNMEACNDVTEE